MVARCKRRVDQGCHTIACVSGVTARLGKGDSPYWPGVARLSLVMYIVGFRRLPLGRDGARDSLAREGDLPHERGVGSSLKVPDSDGFRRSLIARDGSRDARQTSKQRTHDHVV